MNMLIMRRRRECEANWGERINFSKTLARPRENFTLLEGNRQKAAQKAKLGWHEKSSRYIVCVVCCAPATVDASFNHHTIHIITPLLLLLLLLASGSWLALSLSHSLGKKKGSDKIKPAGELTHLIIPPSKKKHKGEKRRYSVNNRRRPPGSARRARAKQ